MKTLTKPTPPKYRCRVVFDPNKGGFNVVQVTPGGRGCGISKSYFSDLGVNRYRDGLPWNTAVQVCHRANLDRMDSIFNVSRNAPSYDGAEVSGTVEG